MKYRLETIPVWDACTAPSECPLCVLARPAGQDYPVFFLGGSVMEPEIRLPVNRTGFCPRRLARLPEGAHRSGGEAGPRVRAALEREVRRLPGMIPVRPGTPMGRLEEADG